MTAFERLPVGVRGPAEPAPRALELPRFELMPIKGALEAADHLPRNAEVAVSCSPTLGIENTLALAEELSGRGFRVVPHLAARLVTGEGHLGKLLRRMDDRGLREVFVVGGASTGSRGPFTSGLELLETISRLGHRFERIGVRPTRRGAPSSTGRG